MEHARWSGRVGFAVLVVFAAAVVRAEFKSPPPPPAPSVPVAVAVASYAAGAFTKVGLEGADLAPGADGKVKVSVSAGTIRLDVSVRGLPEPRALAPGFETYVLWAVTSEGRARNLGEIPVSKGKGRLRATTQAPAFGLVVTAEPHFAVASPSELVVLRNVFEGKAAAHAATTEATVEAFARGTYESAAESDAETSGRTAPEILQARNALRVARAFDAANWAGDALARASRALEEAETLAAEKNDRLAAAKARESVQSAEAARLLAVAKIEQARIDAEKADAAERAAEARAQSEEAQARAEAEARRRAEAEQAAADSERARLRAEDERLLAEAEKHALRTRLLRQLNLVLETRDSARGLIVNLGDVLFDVDKFTLRPEAREKLAKLSGIVLANSGLVLEVEGHTDATGGDEYNQKLSESRAGAVRDYLVEQGVAAESITSKGFGKARPVASNDTPEGRQKNRRVEIVVSGDVIGTDLAREKETTEPEP